MAIIELPAQKKGDDKAREAAEIIAQKEIEDIEDSFSVLLMGTKVFYILGRYKEDIKKFKSDFLEKVKADLYCPDGKLKEEEVQKIVRIYSRNFGKDVKNAEDLYEIVKDMQP